MVCLAYATAWRTRILAGASRGSAWLPADDSAAQNRYPASARPGRGMYRISSRDGTFRGHGVSLVYRLIPVQALGVDDGR